MALGYMMANIKSARYLRPIKNSTAIWVCTKHFCINKKATFIIFSKDLLHDFWVQFPAVAHR